MWGASGQVCTAGTRVLVQRGIYEDFITQVKANDGEPRHRATGFDPASQLGPVVSQDQLERITRYVGIGQDEGAEVLLGGRRRGEHGYFFEPTIFTGVSNSMRIAQEEIFGPVMCALPFDTEEEAYAIANDVEFGLAAGVWTNDLARAHRASRALQAGTVWVNTYGEVQMAVPYGGMKQSGHARTLGEESIRELTQTKSVWMRIAADRATVDELDRQGRGRHRCGQRHRPRPRRAVRRRGHARGARRRRRERRSSGPPPRWATAGAEVADGGHRRQ